MTTPSTKTKALCVATRCTSVEQFVAAFHRFCGDDETFFVATMASRPVGLETPFAIQLADKQPVLRGLCVVLDAWATPDNRYKRPGIRLGIKRLTTDSQPIFERLKAASKSPTDEVSSSTGIPVRPAPTLPAIPLHIPAVRATPPTTPVAVPKPIASTSEITAPTAAVIAAAMAAGATAQPVQPLATPPALAAVTPPAEPPTAQPAKPIAVTRFRVALHVDTTPPPLSNVEFKPKELIRRGRSTTPPPPAVAPNATREAAHDTVPTPLVAASPPDTAVSPSPPVELASPGEPLASPPPDQVSPPPPLSPLDPLSSSYLPPLLPPDPALAFASGPPSHALVLAPPPSLALSGLRTPGSPLVLPANPFQDLTDASLEAFVDCTLYEAADAFFYPDPIPPAVDDLYGQPVALSPFQAASWYPPLPAVVAFAPPQVPAFPIGSDAIWDVPSTVPDKPRWLLIATTTVVAILLAFFIARLARGKDPHRAPHAGSLAVATAPAAITPPPAPPPAIVTPIDPAAAATPLVGAGACRVTIATNPAGSTVKLNDQLLGISPLTISAPCEKHKLSVARARYQTTTQWLTLSDGEARTLSITLARPVHTVTVTSSPPGADILVDGRRAGTTPAVLQLAGFAAVQVTFTKPGFQPITRKLYSKTPQDRFSVKLTR